MIEVAAVGIGVGILGALIGSFLNVVVHRVPAGRSVVVPPSSCPTCCVQIRAYDNVPVLSWLILKGKCRGCRNRISIRYPLVELATAAFFAAVVFSFAPSFTADALPGTGGASVSTVMPPLLVLVAFLYLAAISVALALIDLDTHRLPNAIVLPAYPIAGALLVTAAILTADYSALIGAMIGMPALWFAYFVMALVFPGGMGLGDVKLAGVLGLFPGWLGWGPLVVGAFSAFLLGGLFSIVLLALRRANRRSGIPFGPWMLLGAWLGIFFGQSIWNAYLNLYGLS